MKKFNKCGKGLIYSFKFLVILQILFIGKSMASCYFPPELQGTFTTQGTIDENIIQYSQINITGDSIPIWGICHRRFENNVILMISSEETTCFRCFNLKLVARNILRVCTADPDYITLLNKCYTNEEKAIASCASEEMLSDSSQYTEIILYKNLEMDGQEIRREFCPINGRYKLKYNVDDGQENFMECPEPTSELDNCPSGSALNLRFKKCSFEDHEITFECLGHWEGLEGQQYLALMNTGSGKGTLGPQYRCAIYQEDPHTGVISISFSKDSTCSAIYKLIDKNKTEKIPRLEILTLYPTEDNVWPQSNLCEYPVWMQGHWEHVTVKNDTLVFRDQTSYKTYTMKCIENVTDRILVFSRTQCGEEVYQCLQIKYRSPNIMEFQIGLKSSHNYSHSICTNEDFDDERWLTQGRLDHNYVYSPCPVRGEFTGKIPDASSLCAKLSSECSSEDIMYYEVSACEYGEIYEARKYRCLGQWEENGRVYTYTKRLDFGSYECFVGARVSEKQVFIKEAGEHCQRKLNPYRYGMELNKIASCKKETTIMNDTTTELPKTIITTKSTTVAPRKNVTQFTSTFSTTTEGISNVVSSSFRNANYKLDLIILANLLIVCMKLYYQKYQ